MDKNLRYVEVGLHYEERVQGISPRCIGIVKEVFHFIECSLARGSSPILLRRKLQPQGLRSVAEGRKDPTV